MKPIQARSKITQFGRDLGWILLCIHTLLALIALTSFSNGWWSAIFFVDMPASWPVYLLMDFVKGDFIPWVAFTLVGSCWQFFWPQALAFLVDWIVQWFKQSKSRHSAA